MNPTQVMIANLIKVGDWGGDRVDASRAPGTFLLAFVVFRLPDCCSLAFMVRAPSFLRLGGFTIGRAAQVESGVEGVRFVFRV